MSFQIAKDMHDVSEGEFRAVMTELKPVFDEAIRVVRLVVF